jgi:hypothetical protein
MRRIGLAVVLAVSLILVQFANRFGCHSYR